MRWLVSVFLCWSAVSAASWAGNPTCLRSDAVGQISMAGATKAIATDKQGAKFDVVFLAPCGARYQNTYFVLHPENMPACIAAGTALPTNDRGVCVVTSVVARK